MLPLWGTSLATMPAMSSPRISLIALGLLFFDTGTPTSISAKDPNQASFASTKLIRKMPRSQNNEQHISDSSVASSSSSGIAPDLQTHTAQGFTVRNVEDVYPGDTDKQNLYCYLKKALSEISEIADEKLRHELVAKSCAVVSNSGALLANEQGNAIDGDHDVVFRFGSSPTAGYEKHVGARTDYKMQGSHTGVSLISSSTHQEYPVLGKVNGHSQTRAVAKEFADLYPHRMGMHRVPEAGMHAPTQGVLGMLAAITNCQTVDAYEMTPSKSATSYPYHYYDDPFSGDPTVQEDGITGQVKADDNAFHGMIKAEHDLWRRLSSGSSDDCDQLGKTSYAGFTTVQCPDTVSHPGVLGFLNGVQNTTTGGTEWKLVLQMP
mmetsp:Transcript_98954/g.154659  ORF Transcript_98954/g.154659 Transcript_98954/m.154659 type:complete len:378 (+) Transcript_98954:2-1135(+)